MNVFRVVEKYNKETIFPIILIGRLFTQNKLVGLTLKSKQIGITLLKQVNSLYIIYIERFTAFSATTILTHNLPKHEKKG